MHRNSLKSKQDKCGRDWKFYEEIASRNWRNPLLQSWCFKRMQELDEQMEKIRLVLEIGGDADGCRYSL